MGPKRPAQAVLVNSGGSAWPGDSTLASPDGELVFLLCMLSCELNISSGLMHLSADPRRGSASCESRELLRTKVLPRRPAGVLAGLALRPTTTDHELRWSDLRSLASWGDSAVVSCSQSGDGLVAGQEDVVDWLYPRARCWPIEDVWYARATELGLVAGEKVNAFADGFSPGLGARGLRARVGDGQAVSGTRSNIELSPGPSGGRVPPKLGVLCGFFKAAGLSSTIVPVWKIPSVVSRPERPT
jgi:hypothetical protein